MSLYLIIMLGTIAGPLLLSFDKKVHFYTYFRPLITSIAIVALGFIIWDEYFTINGIWGFNPDYLQGIFLGHLPLEEVLFFFLVPYACLFIHQVLKEYFPSLRVDLLATPFAYVFGLTALVLSLCFYHQWYTATACFLAFGLTILFKFVLKAPWYANFVFTYLVAVIPFVVVNGLLTGMATPEPIVWYNEGHIIGPRIITIPIEDLFYNYDMLILVVFLFEKFNKSK